MTDFTMPLANSITLSTPTEEIIRIDKEGFHYRGQFIADAGEAHRLMVEFLRQQTQPEPQGVPMTELSTEWQPCVKLPITVHVREQRPGETHVSTREGITPVQPDDLIMRGVQGEEYPIGRELFNQTYRMLEDGND